MFFLVFFIVGCQGFRKKSAVGPQKIACEILNSKLLSTGHPVKCKSKSLWWNLLWMLCVYQQSPQIWALHLCRPLICCQPGRPAGGKTLPLCPPFPGACIPLPPGSLIKSEGARFSQELRPCSLDAGCVSSSHPLTILPLMCLEISSSTKPV